MTLQLHDIHKRFGTLRANDGVDLVVEAGTIHGLLGENGAGKSTLMKILSGFIRSDRGEILLEGRRLRLREPQDALAVGIGMLHQDPLVFLPFNVLDNFMLAMPGSIDRGAASRSLREFEARFGFRFDHDAPVRTLTVGERQQLEICWLLGLGARVLILDEPTTGISAAQRATLFQTLRDLAEHGMSVIFVSHKLEEVEEICHLATVMRQGRVVGSVPIPTPAAQLVQMMFGHPLPERAQPSVTLGAEMLRVESVDARDRHLVTSDLSLSVRAGEVVGLAGLEGSGQRTLLRVSAGLLEPEVGRVLVGGRDLTGRTYHSFMAAGVHYLPAGRLEEGLMAGLSVSEHFELARPDGSRVIDWDGAADRARRKIETHSIRGQPDSPVESLSGGNQQRLLLALVPEPVGLLLMEHPTRGLDLESAEWIWEQILLRRESGTAIVFASSDLEELLHYSDRILVFFAGSVAAELDAASTDVEELGHLIGGRVRA
ncbi:MAG TPA: ATP-binding cassette domain-containing protein [Acidimicrobiia bacterium]